MSDKDKTKILVCMTVQMGLWNPENVVEGSIEKYCAFCGIPVNVSKSGQKMMAEDPEVKICCIQCVKKNISEDAETELAPGALEEAKEHLDKLNQ